VLFGMDDTSSEPNCCATTDIEGRERYQRKKQRDGFVLEATRIDKIEC
jgi:hypothetical protein